MILYFSGTGNSRKIAETIAEDLHDEVISLNDKIKKGSRETVNSDQALVFVTPVYAGRLPRVVEEYIRSILFTGNKKSYFVVTCYMTAHNEEKYIKKMCQEIGLTFAGFCSVKMPQSYIVMYEPPTKAVAKKIVAKGIEEAHKISLKIKNDSIVEDTEHKVNFSEKLMSSVINPIMYGIMIKAKDFKTTDACNGCGTCENICPLNNITLQNNKPKWENKCAHCMACINACPNKAIEYGHKTEGKNRYYLK